MPAPSSLHPVTNVLIRNELEKLRREKLEPWLFMSFGDGLNITDFYGKPIRLRGVLFSGSARLVFWGFIPPFLEDVALRVLERALALCRSEGHNEGLVLQETAHLLKDMIDKTFMIMRDTDSRLVGMAGSNEGAPADQSLRVEALKDFVDARVRGLLATSTGREPAASRGTGGDTWNVHVAGPVIGNVGPLSGQATVNASGFFGDAGPMLQSLAEHIAQYAEHMGLPPEKRAEIQGHAAVLKTELAQPTPSLPRLKAVLGSIKSVAEGVAGNVIAAWIIELLGRPEVQQLMRRLF